MNDKGVLPQFNGVLCHDHWKPYYHYTACLHAVCNAHHLRELERPHEQDNQQWAKDLQALMQAILERSKHKAVHSLPNKPDTSQNTTETC